MGNIHPKSHESGVTLLEVIVALGLFGLLTIAVSALLTLNSKLSGHLESRGKVDDVHMFVRSSVSCTLTLAGQQAACATGEFIKVLDHEGRELISKYPAIKYYDKTIGLRSRCQLKDNFFALTTDYNMSRDGIALKNQLTGKSYDWQDLSNGIPFACPCVELLANSKADVAPSLPYPGLVRTTYYFANEAVDPGGTGNDKCTNYGLTPFPVRPPATMALTSFAIPTDMLNDMIFSQDVKVIEFTAFSHQFLFGLDRVGIDFVAGTNVATVEAPPNISGSYGYLQISNLRIDNGVPIGTVSMRAFEHFGGATALGIGSVQDATNLINPMSPIVPPSKVFADIDLRNFKVTIRLYADSYDSIQYRAIRANLWADKPLALPATCAP